MGANWKITKGGAKSTKSQAAKEDVLPHLKELKITKDMIEGTRVFAEQYNAMRAKLLEHGLMKTK